MKNRIAKYLNIFIQYSQKFCLKLKVDDKIVNVPKFNFDFKYLLQQSFSTCNINYVHWLTL